MKVVMGAVSALALLGAVGAAGAHDVIGTVEDIDSFENRIELQQGGIYELPRDVRASGLNVGDTVRLDVYAGESGRLYADDIEVLSRSPATSSYGRTTLLRDRTTLHERTTIAENDYVSVPGSGVGTVAETDPVNNRMTLTNGQVFTLDGDPGANDLEIGDVVEIHANAYEDGYIKVNTLDVIGHRSTALSRTTTPYSEGETLATVTDIDPVRDRIALNDGSVYELVSGLDGSDIDVGDTVRVEWHTGTDGFRVARNVTEIRGRL